MSTWLIVVATATYVWAAASKVWSGDWQSGIIWAGYAVANVGLIVKGVS